MVDTSVRALFLVTLLSLALSACSSPEPLETRVAKYWSARQERDAEKAYAFENPAIRGAKNDYIVRMGGGPLVIHSFKVKAAKVDGDKASVELDVKYRHAAMPRDVDGMISDHWLKVAGEWVHNPPQPMADAAAEPPPAGPGADSGKQ